MVEHFADNGEVVGSSPLRRAILTSGSSLIWIRHCVWDTEIAGSSPVFLITEEVLSSSGSPLTIEY